MNWVIIAICILVVIIFISVVIKLHLKKRLDDIDGFNGVHTVDMNKDGETVIGRFGDDH